MALTSMSTWSRCGSRPRPRRCSLRNGAGSRRYNGWPQRRNDRVQPVRKRGGTGLQDQRRFDFDDPAVTDSRNFAPTGPISDLVGHDFLAAPRCQDHVRRRIAHQIGRNDPILCSLLKSQVWQHVLSAGDFDQFGNPADAADQRIVPFLEIDLWFGRGPGGRCYCGEALLVPGCELIGAIGCTTSAPTMRIIARMPATLRWLKTWTGMPARTRSETISACKSENASMRSGSSFRIFGMSAEMNAETRGFSRLTRGGRTA